MSYPVSFVDICLFDDPEELFYVVRIVDLKMDGMDIKVRIVAIQVFTNDCEFIILMIVLNTLPIACKFIDFLLHVNAFIEYNLVDI